MRVYVRKPVRLNRKSTLFNSRMTSSQRPMLSLIRKWCQCLKLWKDLKVIHLQKRGKKLPHSERRTRGRSRRSKLTFRNGSKRRFNSKSQGKTAQFQAKRSHHWKRRKHLQSHLNTTVTGILKIERNGSQSAPPMVPLDQFALPNIECSS